MKEGARYQPNTNRDGKKGKETKGMKGKSNWKSSQEFSRKSSALPALLRAGWAHLHGW
jgi:hypothetical protein